MSQRHTNILRMLGSAGLCGAYLLITSGLVWQGVVLNSICQFLLMPFAIRTRSWDFLGLSGFFLGYNLKFLLGF
ncbi:hypothetical protein S-CBS2_gp059 [Synechococcus phage S-CBS2]|uniref:hypothetical protein n=1 Tax=Synechococcus phage S-CBS2 TaxID=753084 RepID=UPI0002078414|nr:hypothetical protein S-CBS2_gp059 [Synechococcus phage S-CBS2]ADF42415.1 hypothetical protein S-CBS2_gp059 [Synechococcus phage S-CBS2]